MTAPTSGAESSVLLGAHRGNQALATLRPTAREDTTTARSAHAGTETMTALPFDVAGLVGALHDELRILPMITRQRTHHRWRSGGVSRAPAPSIGAGGLEQSAVGAITHPWLCQRNPWLFARGPRGNHLNRPPPSTGPRGARRAPPTSARRRDLHRGLRASRGVEPAHLTCRTMDTTRVFLQADHCSRIASV